MRSVKIALKKVIGRSTLDYDELSTALTEIEGVINARPTTYVYDDEKSVLYALSPSQLIYGRRLGSSPNSQQDEIVRVDQRPIQNLVPIWLSSFSRYSTLFDMQITQHCAY